MKQTERRFPEKLNRIYKQLIRLRIPFRIIFIFMGVASTLWFLIRVIPKPSRATYPCMQAAAPIMSGFIIWLISFASSVIAFKKARSLYRRSKLMSAFAFIIMAVVFGLMVSLQTGKRLSAKPIVYQTSYEANEPYGEGQGIFPGRVVWAWDPDATNEDCTNSWGSRTDPNDDDGYFLPQNNDQSVIDSLLSVSVLDLTGEKTVNNAWKALFKYHNNKKGLGEETYTTGQTIFIKINQGSADWMSDPSDLSISTDLDWRAAYYGIAETLPQLILSVLKHLVDTCGIPQDKIYIGDPRSHIFKHTYDYLVAVYPNVKYFDQSYSTLGRTSSAGSGSTVLTYSDKGTIMKQAITDHLYQEMETADYLINMACLKGHERAGITLTAKNHFGSHTRLSAAHLHPGLVWVSKDDWEGNYDLMRTDYGMYRVQVDIMGYKYLGGNTMLFMVDGFWGSPEATQKPVKWKIAPFNNDWPSSLFISQDQVALESVCFDLLRTEFTEQNHPGRAYPNYPATDDYLHQAADSSRWPEGITYDPENDGTPIGSLGIHEHWNNLQNKQYSRNLGMDYGIELFAPGLVNNAPQMVKQADIVKIHKNSKPVYLVNNLNELFTDPDGDILTFSVSPENSDEVDAMVEGDTALVIMSGNDFTGINDLTIHVSDGTDTITETMQVNVIDETFMAAIQTEEEFTFDGFGNEAAWENSAWYYIDQVWIPYRGEMSANDFTGRYKVAWSADSNLIYFLAETYDDVFVDGYVYNSSPALGGNYPSYDILEIFIDEDKSGGKHVFDDGTDWGTNGENAFSYHITINQPDDGETVTDFVVCDIAGTSWSSYTIPDYAKHFHDFIVRRNGNKLTWEFSLKVYNDTYDDAQPENSRTVLSLGKQIGMSLAYCDNDDPDEDPKTRDNFIGSDIGPDQALSEWNEHWMNADVYGTLKLDDDQPNQAPEVTGTIDELLLEALNTPYTACEDLNQVFSDPDNDQLVFTASSQNANLNIEIQHDTVIVVTALSGFSGIAEVNVKASDGELAVSVKFAVTSTLDVEQQNEFEESVMIWPNPAVYDLRILMGNDLYGNIEIRVLDLSGRLINRYEVLKNNRFLEYTLNLSDLNPGIYMVQVKQGNMVITKRIVH